MASKTEIFGALPIDGYTYLSPSRVAIKFINSPQDVLNQKKVISLFVKKFLDLRRLEYFLYFRNCLADSMRLYSVSFNSPESLLSK